MKKEEIIETIDNSIANSDNARIYFKSYRSPVYGRFVKLEDHEELRSKGFVRFASDAYIIANHYSAKIFAVEDIKEIMLFPASI